MKITATLLATTLLFLTGAAQANFINPFNSNLTVEQEQAAPAVGQYSFAGHFMMFSPEGEQMNDDPSVTGSITMNMGTGAGTAFIASPNTFFGYNWAVRDFTLQGTGPNTLHADMYFDFLTPDSTPNDGTHVTLDYSVVSNGLGGYTLTTLTCAPNSMGCDSIPGNPSDSGAFIGFSLAFNGTVTPVPLPATAWLLGSGLLGLIGVARRKAA